MALPADDRPARALHALALVAAARSALGVAVAIADRRAGRDPSAQEPPATATADLRTAGATLAALTVRLRLHGAAPPAPDPARLAQAFETALVRADTAATLRRAHQKLLSLYPAVPEALVEDARRLASDADSPDCTPGALAEGVATWLDDLHDALG